MLADAAHTALVAAALVVFLLVIMTVLPADSILAVAAFLRRALRAFNTALAIFL